MQNEQERIKEIVDLPEVQEHLKRDFKEAIGGTVARALKESTNITQEQKEQITDRIADSILNQDGMREKVVTAIRKDTLTEFVKDLQVQIVNLADQLSPLYKQEEAEKEQPKPLTEAEKKREVAELKKSQQERGSHLSQKHQNEREQMSQREKKEQQKRQQYKEELIPLQIQLTHLQAQDPLGAMPSLKLDLEGQELVLADEDPYPSQQVLDARAEASQEITLQLQGTEPLRLSPETSQNLRQRVQRVQGLQGLHQPLNREEQLQHHMQQFERRREQIQGWVQIDEVQQKIQKVQQQFEQSIGKNEGRGAMEQRHWNEKKKQEDQFKKESEQQKQRHEAQLGGIQLNARGDQMIPAANIGNLQPANNAKSVTKKEEKCRIF